MADKLRQVCATIKRKFINDNLAVLIFAGAHGDGLESRTVIEGTVAEGEIAIVHRQGLDGGVLLEGILQHLLHGILVLVAGGLADLQCVALVFVIHAGDDRLGHIALIIRDQVVPEHIVMVPAVEGCQGKGAQAVHVEGQAGNRILGQAAGGHDDLEAVDRLLVQQLRSRHGHLAAFHRRRQYDIVGQHNVHGLVRDGGAVGRNQAQAKVRGGIDGVVLLFRIAGEGFLHRVRALGPDQPGADGRAGGHGRDAVRAGDLLLAVDDAVQVFAAGEGILLDDQLLVGIADGHGLKRRAAGEGRFSDVRHRAVDRHGLQRGLVLEGFAVNRDILVGPDGQRLQGGIELRQHSPQIGHGAGDIQAGKR